MLDGFTALSVEISTNLRTLWRTALDTLSAGMSDDLEAAVLEGATMVRIGSAIFGRRGAA